MGYESISPRVITVDPVDDNEMEDKQGGDEVPTAGPAARTFLERHMPAGNTLGSAGRDTGEGNDDDDDNEASDQGETDGELEIEGPGVDGVPVVAVGAAAGFLMSSTYNARALSGIGPHIQRIFAQRAWGCCGSTVCIWRAHRCRLLGGVLGRLSVGRVGRASPPDLFLGSGVL